MSADEQVLLQARARGFREAEAQAAGTARAVRSVGAAGDTAGRQLRSAARHSFWWNQAMFTMRRLVYDVTLGLGAMTTAAVYMGVRFNMTMESSRMAFTQLLGSEQAANAELDLLYKRAAETPFEFAQLTDATRRFLAFGFTVEEANENMRVIGDTVAAFGGGTAEINRATLAIGQMKAAGRVMGGEIRQLYELGIPAFQILQEELGLTADQMRNIGELGLPSDIAIPALMRGLDKRFAGMAEKQQTTMMGRITTLRDYASQAFGLMLTPLYDKIRDKLLPSLSDAAQAMTDTLRAGGSFTQGIKAMDDAAGAGGHLYNNFVKVRDIGQDLWVVLAAIWRTLVDIYRELGPFASGTWIAAGALSFMADNSEGTAFAFKVLIYYLLLARGATFLWFVMSGKMVIQLVKLAKATALARGAVMLYTLWVLRAEYATLLWGAATRIIAFLGLLSIAIQLAALSTWAFTIALLANPITWIVLGIVALIAIIVLMITHWEQTKAILMDLWNWIKSNWPYLLIALTGPLGLAVVLIIKNWERLKSWFFDFFGWLKQQAKDTGADLAKYLIPGYAQYKGTRALVEFAWGNRGFAGGGMVSMAGNYLVGERGPEILSLPAGARIASNQDAFGGGMGLGGFKMTPLPVVLRLNNKVVAEASAEYELSKEEVL